MRYYTTNGHGYELTNNSVRVWNEDGSYFMTMSYWGFQSYFGFDAREI